MQKGKVVAIPVPTSKRRELISSLKNTSDARITRGNGFTKTVYKGKLRAELTHEGFQYLCTSNNPNFETDENGDPLSMTLDIDPVNSIARRDFSPAADYLPLKLLELKHPYSKIFPIFFPDGKWDVDDTSRNPQISEN